MKCIIEMNNKKIKQYLGKNLKQKEFDEFCKDAVASKIFELQFIKKQKEK